MKRFNETAKEKKSSFSIHFLFLFFLSIPTQKKFFLDTVFFFPDSSPVRSRDSLLSERFYTTAPLNCSTFLFFLRVTISFFFFSLRNREKIKQKAKQQLKGELVHCGS
jgi:hypothetical protein